MLENFGEIETEFSASVSRSHRGITCNHVGDMLLSLDLTCPHLPSHDLKCCRQKKVARVKKVEDRGLKPGPPLHNVFRGTIRGKLLLA